jgi:hypothetical protein
VLGHYGTEMGHTGSAILLRWLKIAVF